MTFRINEILAQMAALEDEPRDTLHAQEQRMFFQIKGRRVEFERAVRDAHRELKTGLLRWRRFLAYGDGADCEARLEAVRVAMGKPD